MDQSTKRKASAMEGNVTSSTEPQAAESDPAAAAALEFARVCGKLKQTLRTGWVRHGVNQPESVADHSWRVAVLCLLVGKEENVNVGKCMQLAIVHDLAESIVGDICPDDGISKEAKKQLEEDAMKSISAVLKRATNGSSSDDCAEQQQDDLSQSPSEVLTRLFEEYEERQSAESIVVKDLDMLDMIIQADEYEAGNAADNNNARHLEDFFVSTLPGKFRTAVGKRIAQQVQRERNKRIQEHQRQQTQAVVDKDTAVPAMTMDFGASDDQFVDSFLASHSGWKRENVMEIVAALRKHDKEHHSGQHGMAP